MITVHFSCSPIPVIYYVLMHFLTPGEESLPTTVHSLVPEYPDQQLGLSGHTSGSDHSNKARPGNISGSSKDSVSYFI